MRGGNWGKGIVRGIWEVREWRGTEWENEEKVRKVRVVPIITVCLVVSVSGDGVWGEVRWGRIACNRKWGGRRGYALLKSQYHIMVTISFVLLSLSPILDSPSSVSIIGCSIFLERQDWGRRKPQVGWRTKDTLMCYSVNPLCTLLAIPPSIPSIPHHDDLTLPYTVASRRRECNPKLYGQRKRNTQGTSYDVMAL